VSSLKNPDSFAESLTQKKGKEKKKAQTSMAVIFLSPFVKSVN
jgi:hypothetical protein